MTTAPPFTEPTRGSHAAALLLCRCGVEIWRTTYESDAHEVSNFGRIRYATTKRVLKGCVLSTGYRQYQIAGVGCQSHRVVARAFIPNPDSKPTVDHYKSSEKSNNKLTNLRWATAAEQNANTERPATNEKNQRPVRMLDKDTREFIRRFDSATAAARYLNKRRPVNIGLALRGRSRTAYGFVWEYEPVETIEGEQWRPISRELFDLRESHEVSSHGRIKNLTTGRVRTGSTQNNGTFAFALTFAGGGRAREIPVARIVASVFLENPESKPVVMHVDGDKANNHVSNLTWATHMEMTRAACDRGRLNSWTEEEDAALFNMYESHGRPKRLRLTELPEVLQGRTKSAIRSRLCNLLENGIGKPKQWTEEEDAALRDFVESNRDNRGRIKWKDIMLPEILQNRTVQALKHRLHLLNQSET